MCNDPVTGVSVAEFIVDAMPQTVLPKHSSCLLVVVFSSRFAWEWWAVIKCINWTDATTLGPFKYSHNITFELLVYSMLGCLTGCPVDFSSLLSCRATFSSGLVFKHGSYPLQVVFCGWVMGAAGCEVNG